MPHPHVMCSTYFPSYFYSLNENLNWFTYCTWLLKSLKFSCLFVFNVSMVSSLKKKKNNLYFLLLQKPNHVSPDLTNCYLVVFFKLYFKYLGKTASEVLPVASQQAHIWHSYPVDSLWDGHVSLTHPFHSSSANVS